MGDGPDVCITRPGGEKHITTKGECFFVYLPYCALPRLFGECILIVCNF
jgi:hypothetical protein